MKTLIIGMGALGGLIAARLRGAGLAVWLATRDAEQADRLRASGLRVTGMGGSVTVQATAIAPLDAYGADDKFELVLLATKAHDAIEVAPKLSLLLGPNATLLAIQVSRPPLVMPSPRQPGGIGSTSMVSGCAPVASATESASS